MYIYGENYREKEKLLVQLAEKLFGNCRVPRCRSDSRQAATLVALHLGWVKVLGGGCALAGCARARQVFVQLMV